MSKKAILRHITVDHHHRQLTGNPAPYTNKWYYQFHTSLHRHRDLANQNLDHDHYQDWSQRRIQ